LLLGTDDVLQRCPELASQIAVGHDDDADHVTSGLMPPRFGPLSSSGGWGPRNSDHASLIAQVCTAPS
jgi:hypothetical protein